MTSDGDPPEFPFGGMPFLGDLGRLLGAGGAGNQWGAARQIAFSLANDGQPEGNVDPGERIEIVELARVAEMRVVDALGLAPPGGGIEIVPVNRTQWADRSLDAYKPLFERLTAALGQGPAEATEMDPSDPMSAMLGSMMKMLGPMMLSMTAGSMVGHLARRTLGQYDIPIPRSGNQIIVVPPNLDEFADEWSLPGQDLRLWVCLHEITHHLVLSVPHIGSTLQDLLLEFAGGFRSDPGALEDRLGALDLSNPDALGDLQSAFGDPEVVLGAITSPEQQAMMPRLEALTAVIIGVVDHTMDRIGGNLIGSYGRLTEALRRRRVEADQADRFIERMLGLTLTQDAVERGSAFVEGVIERAGPEGLERLWADAANLPTPNEVDAPGLWLARIDLE
jgi:putative hydrolase